MIKLYRLHFSEPPPPYESRPVAYSTDIPYFVGRENLKGVYLFGAGSIANAHSEKEFVAIADLEKAIDVYVDLALKLLEQ